VNQNSLSRTNENITIEDNGSQGSSHGEQMQVEYILKLLPFPTRGNDVHLGRSISTETNLTKKEVKTMPHSHGDLDLYKRDVDTAL